jgi:hypothetical protein
VNTPVIIALVAGLVCAVAGAWVAVVLLPSSFGPWRTLATSYETHEVPRGTRFSNQSGSVGGVFYRQSLTVYVASDGLFLASPLFSRLGHKPLFIPWSSITNPKRGRYLWHEAIIFQVGSTPATELSLPSMIFDAREIGVGEA